MSFGTDPYFALAEFDQAVPDRRIMGLAFIGSDGVTRVWLHNDVATLKQIDDVADAFRDAATLAQKMLPQGGRA